MFITSSPTKQTDISSTLFDDWTVWAAGLVQTLIHFKTQFISLITFEPGSKTDKAFSDALPTERLDSLSLLPETSC